MAETQANVLDSNLLQGKRDSIQVSKKLKEASTKGRIRDHHAVQASEAVRSMLAFKLQTRSLLLLKRSLCHSERMVLLTSSSNLPTAHRLLRFTTQKSKKKHAMAPTL